MRREAGKAGRNLTAASCGCAALIASNQGHPANPVRRGLCERTTDWTWSSAVEFESPGSGMFQLDRSTISKTETG
jgi:hypothetical protein